MFTLLATNETSKLMLIIKAKEIIKQKVCFSLLSRLRNKHKTAVFNKAIHNINKEDSAR